MRSQPSDGPRMKLALSSQPDTRLRVLFAMASCLSFFRPPINPLGEQDSPGVFLQCPTVAVTGCYAAQRGSDKANMSVREGVSVIVAQTSSVSEEGVRTLSSWRHLAFRTIPKCYI